MCGIVGILSLDPCRPVDPERVQRMRDVLAYRGPDGAGLWADGPVALGHRRLAIVDLAGGHQPMANEAGSVCITYNGEIYNHLALRASLEQRGHRYRTWSDTETILHLYEEEGERCVERLRGMFAFALWDRARSRLLLARDRLGIKPLYYAVSDSELLFSSEIKAILAAGGIRPEFNKIVLPEYLANRFLSGEETFFQGVRKLLPGRTLSWSHHEAPRQRRYWRLPLVQTETNGDGLAGAAREVRERLSSCVRSHLMSDVPLGLFLSGGLDSSGLAALMAPMLKEPIRTFAVGFSEVEANELAYARRVARAVAAEHREVVISPGEFFAVLPRLVWHEDEPIAFSSSVPLYFVARLARNFVKVVLTGEGADELFLGYNRYRMAFWNARLARMASILAPSRVGNGNAALIRRLPGPLRKVAERTFLALPEGPRGLAFENFAVFPEALRRQLLAPGQLSEQADPFEVALRCYREAEGGMLARMSCADLQTYLVELLMKQDQMSMAASIESRVPYLDHELVEHVASLPPRFKLPFWTTKAVLREALRDLVPREVLARKKMGFPVPLGRWFRGPFAWLVEQVLLSSRALDRGLFDPAVLKRLFREHREGAADHGERLWLLLNLEIWQRIFLDQEDPAALLGEAHA